MLWYRLQKMVQVANQSLHSLTPCHQTPHAWL